MTTSEYEIRLKLRVDAKCQNRVLSDAVTELAAITVRDGRFILAGLELVDDASGDVDEDVDAAAIEALRDTHGTWLGYGVEQAAAYGPDGEAELDGGIYRRHPSFAESVSNGDPLAGDTSDAAYAAMSATTESGAQVPDGVVVSGEATVPPTPRRRRTPADPKSFESGDIPV